MIFLYLTSDVRRSLKKNSCHGYLLLYHNLTLLQDDWQQCHTYNALNLNQPINNQNDGNDVTDPATDIALCLMKFKEAREEKKNVICLPCGAALFSSLIIVSEIVCRKSASLKKLFVLWRLLKASSRPR